MMTSKTRYRPKTFKPHNVNTVKSMVDNIRFACPASTRALCAVSRMAIFAWPPSTLSRFGNDRVKGAHGV